MDEDHAVNHPSALLLLLTLPPLLWLIRRADSKRAAILHRFAPTPKPARTRYLSLIAIACITLAIAQPMWKNEPTTSHSGPDIVFLLDVSRSMLADNRLEQAKTAMNDVIAHGAEGRFGLVVFAGNANIECPLTNDYAFLREQLKAASRESVTAGGTRIGDAIRLAAHTAFDDASRSPRELVLISDGGDSDQDAPNAAADLAKRNVRLVVVGAGDENTPGIVPQAMFHGKPVTTKLNREALTTICKAATNCAYTAVTDRSIAQMILDNRSLLTKASDSAASQLTAIFALTAAALMLYESAVPR